MKNLKTLLVFLLLFLQNANARENVLLNDGWTIRSIEFTQKSSTAKPVSLPHTWNAEYADGKQHYNRETMVYERRLSIADTSKRYFLYFEGVNSVADVFVNRKSAGRHFGGYTAFCLEITDLIHKGDNDIEVWASNSYRTDVLPISGDFNVYGGIHRPVHLITTEGDCINPNGTGFATGVVYQQKNVSEKSAALLTETYLSLQSGAKNAPTVQTTVLDADGKTVATASKTLAKANGEMAVKASLTIPNPVLWDGRNNPYLYTVKTQLVVGGKVIDEVAEKTGFRYFNVDAKTGFYLNGKPYDLHGVNRHDDFKGVGSALSMEEYRKDVQLLDDLGATTLRLAHYPHAEPIYDLSDEHGLVVWTEIPLCGPGGYIFTGYLKSVEQNALQSLKELVYQKGHHPSICFWGLFNELLVDDGKNFKEYDNPVAFVEQLNALTHKLDDSRLTCFATCVEQKHFLNAADLIAWNKYFSWQKATEQCSEFFDRAYAEAGGKPVGISEYGRGGSPWQHADPRYADSYDFPGTYHPEEYQTVCHENYWQSIRQKPYLWWKTIWQFSDMQSCIKNEGDTPGRNDKGLVTYDRETQKDSYHFYKAQWNPAPMLHLCSARFVERTHQVTDVKAYTTMESATLYVNGKEVSAQKADELHRVVWKDVALNEGDNQIEVRSENGLVEKAVWNYWAYAGKDRIVEVDASRFKAGQYMEAKADRGTRIGGKLQFTLKERDVVPFTQAAVNQSLEQVKEGPDASVPYFNVRCCTPVPTAYTPQEQGYMVGIDTMVYHHLHSPGFEILPNGDALAIYFSSPCGLTENDTLASFVQCRLRYGSEEWDMPERFFYTEGFNDQSGLLWNDNGKIWFFGGGRNISDYVPFRIATSEDNGATWTFSVPQLSEPMSDCTPQPISNAFRAPDGAIYMAMDADGSQSFLWRSKDEGVTWEDMGGRTGGRHSTIVPLDDKGHLLSIGGKNASVDGWTPKNYSPDWGATWSESEPGMFPQLGSAQRPCIIRLQSGKLLLVSDGYLLKKKIAPPESWKHGHDVFVAISDDNGETWHVRHLPIHQPHNSRPFLSTLGYTTVRQAPNGVIHILTSANRPALHYEFNEAWIYSDEAGDSTAVTAYDNALKDVKGRYLLNGKYTERYPDGKLMHQVTYKKGRKTGREVYYNADGTLAWQWQRNLKTNVGVWTQYYSNGSKKVESTWNLQPTLPKWKRTFCGYVANGPATHWDENGRQTAVYNFENGELVQ